MKTVRLGIIGLGYIGQIHLRHSLKLPNATVSAVADVSPKALNRAKSLGVKKAFTNYEDLLKDPEVEAVIISLPTHLHLQSAIRAAESGKDIFLEKPMAINVEEAKEILSAVQRNSVRLMMGYPLRFCTTFLDVKEKMRNGLLGDIETAHLAYISSGPFFHRADGHSPVPVPDWWFRKELTGGGVLVDLGSHIINLARMFFGEIIDIRSHFEYRFNMDFEDSAICLAKFDSGTVALIDIGWFSQQYALRLDFFGSVGNINVQHSPPSALVGGIQMLSTGRSEFYQPHVDELQYFLRCIINDLPPSPSGQDGIRDLEAISRAYKNQIFREY